MALIIKGDMPKACNWFDENGKHRFCKVNAFCDCEIYTRGEIPSDCPILGEIPDYHGDLISKRALEVQIAHAFHGDMFPDISAGLALNKVMNIITDAPVIVEANNDM